jgi:hypothetical protein
MVVQPTRHLGFQLLGVWLILSAILQSTGVLFAGLGLIMPLIAFVAGVLILIGK